MYKLVLKSFCLLLIAVLFPLKIIVFAAPTVSFISDNRGTYTNNEIPKYEKFEASFNIATQASNYLFPYDPNPPAGITPSTGVSVSAEFTSPDGTIYKQPAFYYQGFQDQVKNNKEWFYPNDTITWKVRFTPNTVGIWQYVLKIQDATGIAQTQSVSFTVTDSTKHGFVKPSLKDPRYFEYDDGTYFPALGYNMNGGDLDNVNPILGNTSKFQIMNQNGIELTRIWPSQFSIYGEAWGKWNSDNRVHQTQEQRLGIINPISSQFSSNYPNLSSPSLPLGSEYYMWLEFNETLSSDGTQQRFTPCRYLSQIPVKQYTSYRIKVRYQDMNLEGPRVAGQPYGFAVKKSNVDLWNASDQTKMCFYPGSGSVLAATYSPPTGQNWSHYPDSQNPSWSILEGSFNSGTTDFLPYLYLTFDNVKSTDADQAAGHVFVDRVWVEENLGSGQYGTNILSKPWMSMHMYINQRDAYSLDKLVDLAKQYNIYFKAVMLEKNDRIFQSIDYNGQPLANNDDDFFYGNNRTITKVRWLQQAWWRYMQARWGYSPNIHSWELLNEGDPGNTKHWALADEFGKYMKCKVFGQDPISDPNVGSVCRYDHPNAHMTSTSFWGSAFPWRFWNNSDKLYADMDYVDQHLYATEGTTDPVLFNDSAAFSNWLSTLPNNFAVGKRKPFIRGETAWNFTSTNLLEINRDNGQWLHDFIWAGINYGGLMEHFFGGGHYTKQIYNLSAIPPYDHRTMFGSYYKFIKDVPLNNGNYVDISALSSIAEIRAWGQKDNVSGNAILWIQNKNHTWKNVVDNISIAPISGTITISGFNPNNSTKVEWWDTYAGVVTSTQNISTDGTGNLVIPITNLTTDIAVKIGNFIAPNPTPIACTGKIGDIDNSGKVTAQDLSSILGYFGTNNTSGDLNCDGRVNVLDLTVALGNFGK